MKLVIAIVNEEDSPNLLDRLGRRGFAATITGTRGGFLRIGNATIFCGVEDEQVEDVLTVFRESCTSRIQYVTPLPPVMEPGEMHIPTPVEKTGRRRNHLRRPRRSLRNDITAPAPCPPRHPTPAMPPIPSPPNNPLHSPKAFSVPLPGSKPLKVFSPRPLRALRGSKAVKRCFSASLRALRGSKAVKGVLRVPPCPPWLKAVKGVLRVPPVPSADQSRKRCSPRPSVPSADKSSKRCSPRPSVALRGSKQ